MSNTTSLYMNIFAVALCGVALVINIMAGNIFFIIVMSMLIPLNLTIAYNKFNQMIKDKAAMKQLAAMKELTGENKNVGN